MTTALTMGATTHILMTVFVRLDIRSYPDPIDVLRAPGDPPEYPLEIDIRILCAFSGAHNGYTISS